MGALNHQQMFNRGCRTTTTRERKLNSQLLREESTAQFNARMEREDREAMTVACPLVESCGAEIGESCCTDSGIRRIRHARRLWMVRKQNG
jgi:hypothetical protein